MKLFDMEDGSIPTFDAATGLWVGAKPPKSVAIEDIELIASAMVKLTDKVEELFKAVAKLEAIEVSRDIDSGGIGDIYE